MSYRVMRGSAAIVSVLGLAVLLLSPVPFPFQCAFAAESAANSNQDAAQINARNCAQSIGKKWDVKTLQKWADPSYRNLIEHDNGQTEKMLAVVREKLGGLKTVKSVTPGLKESARRLFYVEIECEKAPLKMRLEMVAVGGKWKVRAINFDAKELATSAVNPEILTRMKEYVDLTIPKLGRTWSYEEFKAEADPIIFQTDDATAKKRFDIMTNFVGPVQTYKVSQLVRQGVRNGYPVATYKAFFRAKDCDAVALVTVVFQDGRCRISSLNFGKKSQTISAPGAVPQGTAPSNNLMPGGFLPGPGSLPGPGGMPAPFFENNPELRGEFPTNQSAPAINQQPATPDNK